MRTSSLRQLETGTAARHKGQTRPHERPSAWPSTQGSKFFCFLFCLFVFAAPGGGGIWKFPGQDGSSPSHYRDKDGSFTNCTPAGTLNNRFITTSYLKAFT